MRESQTRTLMPNFSDVMSPKPPKLVFFGINFPKRDTPPLVIFTKFGLRKGLLGPHYHA